MSMSLSVFWFWRYSMIKDAAFLKIPDILTKCGKPKIRAIIKAKNILISSMFCTFEH